MTQTTSYILTYITTVYFAFFIMPAPRLTKYWAVTAIHDWCQWYNS